MRRNAPCVSSNRSVTVAAPGPLGGDAGLFATALPASTSTVYKWFYPLLVEGPAGMGRADDGPLDRCGDREPKLPPPHQEDDAVLPILTLLTVSALGLAAPADSKVSPP